MNCEAQREYLLQVQKGKRKGNKGHWVLEGGELVKH